MKETRWLSGDPARIGVYKRKGFYMEPCYSLWDGERWMVGAWGVADAYSTTTPSLTQTGHKYRGLAAQP